MATTPSLPPSFKGVNHLKTPCTSITTTHTFYTDILGFTPQTKWNYHTLSHKLIALMCTHESAKVIVELRYRPTQAAAQKGWDPIRWGLGTRKDLEGRATWLDGKGLRGGTY